MITIGLCLIGFVESLILTATVIAQAKMMAKTTAVLCFVSTVGWFIIVRVAPELSWPVVPMYAASFAVGSYLTVKYFPSHKGAE